MRTKKVKNKISKWDKLSNKAQTHIIQEKKTLCINFAFS